MPYVERGCPILVINPTCSLMLKREYPELLNDPANPRLAEGAKHVAAVTRDFAEYLFELDKEQRFSREFASTPAGDVAYHVPCHLKMQNIGFRSRDLMRRIPGVKVKLVNECSGHDGTWSMKKEFFEMSRGVGQKCFQGMNDTAAAVWTSDCPLAGIHIGQATGREVLHPIRVLARCYRAPETGGFVRSAAEVEPTSSGNYSKRQAPLFACPSTIPTLP